MQMLISKVDSVREKNLTHGERGEKAIKKY